MTHVILFYYYTNTTIKNITSNTTNNSTNNFQIVFNQLVYGISKYASTPIKIILVGATNIVKP